MGHATPAPSPSEAAHLARTLHTSCRNQPGGYGPRPTFARSEADAAGVRRDPEARVSWPLPYMGEYTQRTDERIARLERSLDATEKGLRRAELDIAALATRVKDLETAFSAAPKTASSGTIPAGTLFPGDTLKVTLSGVLPNPNPSATVKFGPSDRRSIPGFADTDEAERSKSYSPLLEAMLASLPAAPQIAPGPPKPSEAGFVEKKMPAEGYEPWKFSPPTTPPKAARFKSEYFPLSSALAGVVRLIPGRGSVTEQEVCDYFRSIPAKLVRHRLNTLVRRDCLGRYEGHLFLTPQGRAMAVGG